MVEDINKEVEIEMDVEEITTEEDEGLTANDFSSGDFVKNPDVGETISFVIEKIKQSEKTTGKNSDTGAEFTIGLKKKNNEILRYDIHTDKGTYTINSWEVFYKLLGPKEGILLEYAKKNNGSFKGAKVSIKRNYNGQFASDNITVKMVMAEMEITEEEAKKLKEEVKVAMKEHTLYSVKFE